MKFLRLFVIALILNSCASVDKYIQSGNYDQALKLGLSKFKKSNKAKFLTGIETAFNSGNSKDLDQISYLQKQNSSDNSVKILRLYEAIEKRQNLLRPLLPLIDKDGNQARVDLLQDLDSQKAIYSNKASDFLYENALKSIELARRGDKEAAKTAYNNLNEYQEINGQNNAKVNAIKAEAKDLGTTYILVKPIVGSEISLNSEMKNLFLDFGTKDIISDWKVAHFVAEKNRNYDLEADLVVTNFDISPEKENTREYEDKKEIEEDTGRKDRDGKKIMQKKEVKAKVFEVYQFKEAITQGLVVLYDIKKNKEISRQDVSSAFRFENYASTYVGDIRALSDISKKRIGNKPVKFPSNNQILGDAIVKLKEDMLSKLKSAYSKL